MKNRDKKNGDLNEKSGKKDDSVFNSSPLPALNPDPEYVKGLIRGGYNHAKA